MGRVIEADPTILNYQVVKNGVQAALQVGWIRSPSAQRMTALIAL